MNLSRLFLLVIAITIVLTVLQLAGYPVLESLMVMTVVDFLTLAAVIEIGKKKPLNNPIDIEKEIVPRLQKIDNIEKACTEMAGKVGNGELEAKLKKHSDDISYLLDKMAKKTMDLEQKINNFGNGLIDSISKLSSRVNGIEEEKKGESFSLGELVYVEEDKEDT
jgi:hypothetical protein